MTDRWPSPIKGPAWDMWRKACDYVDTTILAGAPEEVRSQIYRTPDVGAVLDYMSRLAAWNDVEKTRAAGKVWVRTVMQALQQCREEVAA